MKDVLRLTHKKDIAVIHKNIANVLVDRYLGSCELLRDDLFCVKLHDPSSAVLVDDDDHVVCGGKGDHIFEVVDLIECVLIITG